MEFVSRYGMLYYHDTPWNTGALQGLSLEIDSIESDLSDAASLLSEFCIQQARESYILAAARISALRNDLRKVYFECGFNAVEHVLEVSTFRLDLDKITSLANKFPVIVEDFEYGNHSEIEDISAKEFTFGRFYEDPLIDIALAKERNKQWIADLIQQKATIKILKKKNIAIGFMAYTIKDQRVTLILGGVRTKYRHLAYGFWANILLNLIESVEIRTLISSSNVNVVNLYSYFGFSFTNPQFGLHKHLKPPR